MEFQIFRGDFKLPKWLSPGAQNLLRKILEPNPVKRITIAGIKADEWFEQDYTPANPDDDEEDIFVDNEAFSMHEVVRTCKFSFHYPLSGIFYKFKAFFFHTNKGLYFCNSHLMGAGLLVRPPSSMLSS